MPAVSKMVKDHIESVGNDLVKGQVGRTDGGDEFINQLIALHTKYATLVEECFQDHPLFQKALKEVRCHFNSIFFVLGVWMCTYLCNRAPPGPRSFHELGT